MITIQKVRWQNFLSTGNFLTEVILDSHSTTLISGENGSGKSTVMDAICFALFNKPFRKINKPQLVNSINNKNMFVEIEFQCNSVNYVIKRGLKPAIFQIYSNGNLINQEADSRDYQSILEQTILKINYKTFCQIVILGSANFTPFMQLPAAGRRDIIEDLLDIQVFSKMNFILKDRIQDNKNSIQECDSKIAILNKTIELNKKHLEQLQKNTQRSIDSKLKQIEEYNSSNIELESKLSNKQAKLDQITESINNNKPKIKSKLEKALNSKKELELVIKNHQKEIKFYHDTVSCPVCQQSISDSFKVDQISSRKSSIDSNNSELEEYISTIEKYKEKEDQLNKLIELQQQTVKCVSDIVSNINLNSNLIKSVEREIKELNNQKDDIKPDTESKKVLKQVNKQREELVNQRELYNIALMLLKDGGIKAQIIKQYIPIMNKLINGYLEQMEFFCQFQLNENFEESIKSRYRDEFSFTSFSEGEKMRINLALLFAWREVARMRNSASCNILVLDEVMDSSLDSNGTDEFIKIIKSISKNNNIIIISHKSDQIQDKFDRTIRFEKVKNFSKIANQ